MVMYDILDLQKKIFGTYTKHMHKSTGLLKAA